MDPKPSQPKQASGLAPAEFCRALLADLPGAMAGQPPEVLEAARALLERQIAAAPEAIAFENFLANEILCRPPGPVPRAATLVYNRWSQRLRAETE